MLIGPQTSTGQLVKPTLIGTLLLAKQRMNQLPANEPHLLGFCRTVERITTGKENSPQLVSQALVNAVGNTLLLKYNIIPAGMTVSPEYFTFVQQK